MREDKFKPIRDTFLDYFKREAAKINKDFDYATCNVEVHFPPNDSPEYGNFMMGISCLLKNKEYEGSDNVALGVNVYDWNDRFTLSADVSWGHPSGEFEDEVFENPVEVTAENINIIKKRLPDMVLKLREALTKAQN